MSSKEIQTYTVAIVAPDKTLKSVFSGRPMACVTVANHLIDKYNYEKDKIVFINDTTYAIVTIGYFMQRNPEGRFGSIGKTAKKLIPPWERKEW